MSGHGANSIFFNKTNSDWTSRALATPPPPLRLITSHFYITPPQPKVDVICVSPLRGLVLVKFV